MAFNLPKGAIYASCLQANSPSGGKEWRIAFVPGPKNGLIYIFWGKLNKVNQSKVKEGTLSDYSKMLTDKITGKDRYWETDHWQTDKNCWHSEFKAKLQRPPV